MAQRMIYQNACTPFRAETGASIKRLHAELTRVTCKTGVRRTPARGAEQLERVTKAQSGQELS